MDDACYRKWYPGNISSRYLNILNQEFQNILIRCVLYLKNNSTFVVATRLVNNTLLLLDSAVMLIKSV